MFYENIEELKDDITAFCKLHNYTHSADDVLNYYRNHLTGEYICFSARQIIKAFENDLDKFLNIKESKPVPIIKNTLQVEFDWNIVIAIDDCGEIKIVKHGIIPDNDVYDILEDNEEFHDKEPGLYSAVIRWEGIGEDAEPYIILKKSIFLLTL
jgi:hypothetical protein